MNINKIANKLNEVAYCNGYRFKFLQQYRKNKTGKRNFSKKPFSKSSIKEKYAFHTGGRQEIQFNIGFEKVDGKRVFRYGIAFSLEKGRNLLDPLKIFIPKIKRFNEYYSSNRSFFKDLELQSENEYKSVNKINIKNVKINDFIFIGNYILYKNDKQILRNIDNVLTLFDRLMDLYLYVEDINPMLPLKNRIARVCWNKFNWIEPSGSDGKANIGFESKYGYGHEEWFLESDKSIDGYTYTFLQPINNWYENYIGERFNLFLYTIDRNTKTKYWLGKLENVEVINRKTSEEIYKIYSKKGWIRDRKAQLDNLRIKTDKLDSFWYDSTAHFNIRYKTDQVKFNIFPDPQEFYDNRRIVKSSRYTLLPVKNNPINSTIKSNIGFDLDSGNDGKKTQKGKTKKKYRSFDKELELKHNLLSDSFLKFLKRKYPLQKVKRECRASVGCRVDIVRKAKSGNIFYELKTYNHLIKSFRYAIGQLLEYSYYPNVKNARQLVIVSDIQPNKMDRSYIKHIRQLLDIDLRYIQYDLDNEIIVEET